MVRSQEEEEEEEQEEEQEFRMLGSSSSSLPASRHPLVRQQSDSARQVTPEKPTGTTISR